ncbi:COX15/CtaA family protein [Shimazuella kribbensis]|uniref:COX15/CtaA family protein n=1 Tax=Shimazuella kribbensis TaxID=139808 RepID=UPI00041AC234|nr:heme A synthase [Shimazuella kribbensis]
MKKQYPYLRVLTWLTVLGTYLMLIMGAIVSITESGQGCGNSWPVCNGQLIPNDVSVATVIEYSHRIVSGGIGFLILVLSVWCWISFWSNKKIRWLAFYSLFFVVLQGALGAFTVVFQGDLARDAALALHFGFSLVSFASIVLLNIELRHLMKDQPATRFPIGNKFSIFMWLYVIYTYVVVYTGALVRHAEATMACGYNLPFCGPQLLPSFATPAGIQMIHRYAAGSLWVLMLVLLFVILVKYPERKQLKRTAWIGFILLSLQAVSGILVVLSGGQLLAALLHTTIISLFFTVILYMATSRNWS